jgi:hypothetical protein
MVALKLWAMTVAVVAVVMVLVGFGLNRLNKVADSGEQPPKTK